MRMFRPSRYPTALFLLVSLLFTQLALASYLCPDDRVDMAPSITAHDDAGAAMPPGCYGMDTEQPNLCQANAQAGNQSIDKPLPPHLQPFVAAGIAVVLQEAGVALEGVPPRRDQQLLTRTVAPPIAIRNCCFRI